MRYSRCLNILNTATLAHGRIRRALRAKHPGRTRSRRRCRKSCSSSGKARLRFADRSKVVPRHLSRDSGDARNARAQENNVAASGNRPSPQRGRVPPAAAAIAVRRARASARATRRSGPDDGSTARARQTRENESHSCGHPPFLQRTLSCFKLALRCHRLVRAMSDSDCRGRQADDRTSDSCCPTSSLPACAPSDRLMRASDASMRRHAAW